MQSCPVQNTFWAQFGAAEPKVPSPVINKDCRTETPGAVQKGQCKRRQVSTASPRDAKELQPVAQNIGITWQGTPLLSTDRMLGKVQLAAAAQPSSCVFTRGKRSLQVDSAKAALTNDAQRMEAEGKETTVKGQQVPVAPPRDAIVLHDGQQAMVPLVRCQLHHSTVNTAIPASNF